MDATSEKQVSNEELLAREKKRADFLITLVHEFRNPLTAMSGAIDILRDSLSDRITEKERDFLQIVDVSLARLNRMLDEMLEITNLESRDVTLRYEPTDLRALAAEVLEEYGPRAKIYGVNLNDVEAKVVPKVDCDAVLVRRVLSNLVSNAVKYNSPGGDVTVAITVNGPNVQVSVRDSGPGIPLADQPKIFTRFFRGSEARRQGILGTGLGLAIAKNIIELHGGALTFTSVPGCGATFTFELPVAGRPAEANDGR